MGFRSKLVFLLIVYFAGFATAVYYLSPDGRLAAANASDSNSYDGQSKAVAALTGLRDSAYDKMAGINKQDFKDAYDRGLQAIRNMAKNSQNTASDQTTVDGGEDK